VGAAILKPENVIFTGLTAGLLSLFAGGREKDGVWEGAPGEGCPNYTEWSVWNTRSVGNYWATKDFKIGAQNQNYYEIP
jgi:hypothetical protein